MTQPDFDWTAPVQQGGSIRSRHCSSEGALAAQEVLARQLMKVLTAYGEHGELTDIDVERLTGIQKSSVIPRRRSLQLRGLVMELGTKKNEESGRSNTTYGLVRR